MVGLTSISFRNLDYEEIIEMCAKNGVDIIEWGGDLHVPHGDVELAKKVGKATRDAGMKNFSYGSYYRLGENENIEEDFAPVLASAEALGSKLIRIWAGRTPGVEDMEKLFEDNVAELNIICKMAAEKDIKLGFEYHRNTLTETKEMTLRLLEAVDSEYLCTYWQPNPDITHEDRKAELRLLKDYICNVHVFYWISDDKVDNERYPLADGRHEWEDYWEILEGRNCPGILEFVKDDSVSQFEDDVKELKLQLKK